MIAMPQCASCSVLEALVSGRLHGKQTASERNNLETSPRKLRDWVRSEECGLVGEALRDATKFSKPLSALKIMVGIVCAVFLILILLNPSATYGIPSPAVPSYDTPCIQNANDHTLFTCDMCEDQVPSIYCDGNRYQVGNTSVCTANFSDLSVSYFFHDSEPRLNISFLWTQNHYPKPNVFEIEITALRSPYIGICYKALARPTHARWIGSSNKAYFTYACYDHLHPDMTYKIVISDLGCATMVEENKTLYIPDPQVMCEDISAWNPEVSIEALPSEGRINVSVARCPEVCGCQGYAIQLRRCLGNTNDCTTAKHIKTINTTFDASFVRMTAGSYKAKVCVVPRGKDDCVNKDTFVWSDMVRLQSEEPYTNAATGSTLWVLIVGAGVLALVVIVVVLWIGRKHIPSPRKCMRRVPTTTHIESHDSGDVTTESLISAGSREIKQVVSSTRREKNVLLFFSDDFPEHCDVVRKFATYLETRCACRVSRVELWPKRQDPNLIDWISSQIPISDCVIILTSEGAYKKGEAERQKILLRGKRDSHTRDVFAQVIELIKTEYIFSDTDKPVPKFFMVRFPYCSQDYIISELSARVTCYELMRYIDELVLDIHDMRPFRNGQRTHLPDITGEKFVAFESGAFLRDAIQAAERYVKTNPHWFDQGLLDVDSIVDSGVGMEWTAKSEGIPTRDTSLDSINGNSSDSLEAIENSLAMHNDKFNENIRLYE